MKTVYISDNKVFSTKAAADVNMAISRLADNLSGASSSVRTVEAEIDFRSEVELRIELRKMLDTHTAWSEESKARYLKNVGKE